MLKKKANAIRNGMWYEMVMVLVSYFVTLSIPKIPFSSLSEAVVKMILDQSSRSYKMI